MATPEIKPETILSNRDEAQLYVTDEVVKGMVIAPKLGLATTEEKRVNWFTRDKTSKEQFEDNLIMEPMPTEDGSELLEVSGMELTPNSERVMTYGYMYSVDLDDMLASPESYLMDIQDLCWGISKAIETDVTSTLIAMQLHPLTHQVMVTGIPVPLLPRMYGVTKTIMPTGI
jgi:hypothetical protein